MIYSVRGHLLFSIFLFLLRYELNLYHWDNIWLYPNSFFICFIRKADVSFIVCEGKVYHERNAFIQFRVPMFLISHSCCWDAGEAARGAEEGRLLTLNVSSSKNCLAEETQSSFSYWNRKTSIVSMRKNLFVKKISPNNMKNFHIKVEFHFSF